MPADRLALLAFQNLDGLARRTRELVAANARLWTAFLDASRELEAVPTRATIAFPRFRDGRDSGPFAERLLREHSVAVVPGACFESPSHFRVSLGGDTRALARGLEAISRCLD